MTPTTPDPEAAYYQAVEEYFVARRGDPLFLSNADWTLVRKWRQAGLPLRVVLRGIRDALDGHDHGWSRQRKVGSLAYCEREVDAARERWQRAIALGGDATLEARAALAGFAADLDRASGLGPLSCPVAKEIARELRAVGADAGLANLTAWLTEREGRLSEALRAEESPEQRRLREEQVDASLLSWRERLPAAVVAQIRSEALTRRILELHGLPRLSLFHLEGGGGVSA